MRGRKNKKKQIQKKNNNKKRGEGEIADGREIKLYALGEASGRNCRCGDVALGDTLFISDKEITTVCVCQFSHSLFIFRGGGL